MDKKQVGRPSENRDNRNKLIHAARELFVSLDYDKVSLRAIAKLANVDSALIRYYFQSKLGLFQAMLEETAAPVTQQLRASVKQAEANSPEQLMKTYYQVMSENPDFPKLMFRLASMPSEQHHINFQQILKDTLHPNYVNLFALLQTQGVLKERVDPVCAQVSFFSMMVFPFLMPDIIKQVMGIEINSQFMSQLAQQNALLMQHGYLANVQQKQLDKGHHNDQ